MRLQFGNLADAVYKQWKRKNDEGYIALKAVVLDSLQHPTTGLGNPHQIDFEGRNYWCRTFGESQCIIYSIDGDVLRVEAISEVAHREVAAATEKQHEDAIKLMRRFMDNGKPKLGIFWYDYGNNRLFGVEKGDAELYSSQGKLSTYPKLHKTYWQKMHHKAVAEGNTSSVFYNEHDYTQIPRGRVFQEEGGFFVTVGEWINGEVNGRQCINKELLRVLLIDEFNLPADFQFRQDEHWDIGHGWSEEWF